MAKRQAIFYVFAMQTVRFPAQKHTVYARKTYVSASGNIKGEKGLQIVFFAFLHHSIKKADYSMFRMNLAGTPPTTVLAGTSFVTTAPAAMMALSPMVTPCRMVLSLPIRVSQYDGSRCHGRTLFRIHVVIKCGENHVVPNQATVAQCHSTLVLEMAAGIDKHIFSYMDIFPKISIKRRKYPESVVYWPTKSRDISARISSMV